MSSTMHEISATEFRATCLKVMDDIHNRHINVIITRHGKPVAMLVPVPEVAVSDLFGCMANMALIQGDILAPIEGGWEAKCSDDPRCST